eukprot:1074552-Amphidinium_carterae.1
MRVPQTVRRVPLGRIVQHHGFVATSKLQSAPAVAGTTVLATDAASSRSMQVNRSVAVSTSDTGNLLSQDAPTALSGRFTLSDGQVMPLVGLGVYRVKTSGDVCYQAVRSALERGYRLIDTAAMYGNEQEVGRAIRDSGIPRSEIFVTTKIKPQDHGRGRTRKAGLQSHHSLGIVYVDLLLMHSPTGGKILETWDDMCALRTEGLVRSVGVSNFGVQHLDALAKYRPESMPVVNQIEMHPL